MTGKHQSWLKGGMSFRCAARNLYSCRFDEERDPSLCYWMTRNIKAYYKMIYWFIQCRATTKNW